MQEKNTQRGGQKSDYERDRFQASMLQENNDAEREESYKGCVPVQLI
jgi:hypothetical protein